MLLFFRDRDDSWKKSRYLCSASCSAATLVRVRFLFLLSSPQDTNIIIQQMCCRSQTLHLPVLSAHANHPQEQFKIDITHTPAHPPTDMRLFSHFHHVGAVSSPTRSKPVTWADSTTGQRKTSLSSVNAPHHLDDEAFCSLERHTHTTTRNTQHTTQHTTAHNTHSKHTQA